MKYLVKIIQAMLICCVLVLPAAASAASKPCTSSTDPLACACEADSNQSSACDNGGKNGNPIAGPNGVLKKASLVISSIAGIAAVIIIIVGGFEYVVSNGDAQKTASARSAIIGAVVGLVIIMAAETIILFVVNKL